MWDLKAVPRRMWLAVGAFGLVFALGIGGVVSGVGAGREVDTLAERIAAHENSVSASLAVLRDRLDGIPTGSAREYLVRTCDGGIGVYDSAGEVLYELWPVAVSTLPSADRAMLAEGIIVIGEAALRALSEDYSS